MARLSSKRTTIRFSSSSNTRQAHCTTISDSRSTVCSSRGSSPKVHPPTQERKHRTVQRPVRAHHRRARESRSADQRCRRLTMRSGQEKQPPAQPPPPKPPPPAPPRSTPPPAEPSNPEPPPVESPDTPPPARAARGNPEQPRSSIFRRSARSLSAQSPVSGTIRADCQFVLGGAHCAVTIHRICEQDRQHLVRFVLLQRSDVHRSNQE
jgi:hypothetical protein